jgi:phenylpyruvate tautomerase
MPLCQVVTNVAVAAGPARDALLAELSRRLAQTFGKPEAWVMTGLVSNAAMTFAGTSAPTAFVGVRNVGRMTPADTAALSREICAALERALAIPPARVYLEFGEATEALWGWNGETFA